MIVIRLFPFDSNNNKYISILKDILKDCGITVLPFKKKKEMFFLNRKVEYVYLNWYENISQSLFKTFTGIIILLIIRLRKQKIIWTLHNKQVHDFKQKYSLFNYSRIIYYILFLWSDKIIIHSLSSDSEIQRYKLDFYKIKKKVYYIPHPNYIDEYGPIQQSSCKKVLSILFIGSIKKYKNIELLIDIVKGMPSDSVHLTIAGKPYSSLYASELQERVQGCANINISFDFIDDRKLPKYIANSDLLVLPYDIVSSLNSGTVFLAFSYKRSVICPQIATLEDFSKKDFLTYCYKNDDEHKEQLRGKILEAIELKRNDSLIFEKWGKNMYNEVLKNNSKAIIKERMQYLFADK